MITLEPIGYLKSCYPDKFGTPRQPGLVPSAKATLAIHGQWQPQQALIGLEKYSHIWLIFQFHDNTNLRYHAKVHPPRLDGESIGVFATRSPHRPNPLGLSLVKLDKIENGTLHLSGVDLIEGTPIYDIKPYLPSVESLPNAEEGWSKQASQVKLQVIWNSMHLAQIEEWSEAISMPNLLDLINETLSLDPRPVVYKKDSDNKYREVHAVRFFDGDVHFSYPEPGKIQIEKVFFLPNYRKSFSLNSMQNTVNAPQNKSNRQVPTLSLKSYTEGSSTDQVRFIDQLYTGIKDYGFVVLKDHDVSTELLAEAYELLAQFYSLSSEAKLKYAGVHGGQRGYTPFGKEHAKDSPVMDLKEFWHVGREVPAGHRFSQYYPANVWPSESPRFKSVFTELFQSLDQAGRAMLQALTFPLQVSQLYFDDMVEDGNSILRLLHYPPIPTGTDPRCLRAAPHEDINLITILPAATASGLQLKDRDGTWLNVDGNPGELIVDAGDMLSRITNEEIPSTTHQVINSPEAGSQSRYSMPFFMHPNPEAILSCIPSCRKEGAKYPDISAHDFLMQRLREIGLLKN